MSWVRVREKLLHAKQVAEQSEANWSGIAYDSKPPILEAELAEAETDAGVRFPDEYRDFLKTIGDGGVGPGYGLFPLRASLEERGEGIYGLGDPFEPPRSSLDWVSSAAPGMHLLTHDGCAFYTGLVVSGPESGTVWSFVEVAPGWVPQLQPGYVGPDGEAFVMKGNDFKDYREMYDAMLLPANAPRRIRFVDWFEQWLDGVLEQSAHG